MEQQLREALRSAKARYKKLNTNLSLEKLQDLQAADDVVANAERALSKYLNEPYAVNLEFPSQLRWDIGAPLPHLLQSDYQAFLVFLLATPIVKDSFAIEESTQDLTDNVAIVEFTHCVACKMGSPNDEVIHGHPLYESGLRAYKPMSVENSLWIEELKKVNSVHRGFSVKYWDDKIHYIFGFHDSIFECVADNFSINTSSQSIRATLISLCENLR